MKTARTGLLYRDEMKLHEQGSGHPECPARLDAVTTALRSVGLPLIDVSFEPATRADLLRVHTVGHIDEIEDTCMRDAAYRDPDTQMCPDSWQAALLAAGAAIAACKAVVDGEIDNAFCAIRPPGHHAEKDRAMGFCLFNNVAIAACWLRDVAQVKRVAILDWDVHHGNGTQHAFYDDDSVYYASIHQHPLYPGTGFPHERGANNTNLNTQMAPGSGPVEWLDAIQKRVVPELERFAPDFLLLSSGFDAHAMDPLASQRLESSTYADMTRLVKHLAGGRIVSLLEGGYNLKALGESVAEHVRELQRSVS